MCSRRGAKFTDQRWEEATARDAWKVAGDYSVCGSRHADDGARREATEVARLQVLALPEPAGNHDDQMPGKP
ncbi:hypothetical protein [Streptomyces caelestis]|uniref:hypothetical protein n=1 Tax=Streptomyces caelestis TaxID=36816 RepID=UPI00365E6E28